MTKTIIMKMKINMKMKIMVIKINGMALRQIFCLLFYVNKYYILLEVDILCYIIFRVAVGEIYCVRQTFPI